MRLTNYIGLSIKKLFTETRENVYLITMVSRELCQIVGFDIAFDKSPELQKQSITTQMDILDILLLSIPADIFAIFMIKATHIP